MQLSCIYFLFFSYTINWQTRPDKRSSQLVAAVVDQKALQISAQAGKLEPLLKDFGQQQAIMSRTNIVTIRTGKEIRFRFGSSEDKAGKEAQHQKRSAQRSAFLVLG